MATEPHKGEPWKVSDPHGPAERWLTTLSWPDKIIARCFPRFFKRYAPEDIKQQWAEHLAKKHKNELH